MRLGRAGHHRSARGNPAEAAIVADIHLAVRPERGAVRTAGNLRYDLLAAIGPDPGQAPAANLDQHDRAVRHHHRSFRKFEICGENATIAHETSRNSSLRENQIIEPARATWLDGAYGKVGCACQAS